MNKIILFELNEVPTRIFEYYTKARPNSWIAKNFKKLVKYETFSENEGHLSPWNTWPTLHRGVPDVKHFIAEFNQNLEEVDKAYPPIWTKLSENGIKTGVFGSLHSYPLPKNYDNYSFYIPDVFAPSSECHPKQVELFQDFNLRLSRKSARNVDSSVPISDSFKLLMSLGSLGIKSNTIFKTGKQLFDEKINSWKTVRRRTFQTILSFDVFCKQLNNNKPDFVTFFTNHVASSLHRYWVALFPEEYQNLQYENDWLDRYSNEILFTMDYTDYFLKTLASFVNRNPDYKLIIASSMGQEAVECEPTETQLYISDNNKFFEMLGVPESSAFRTLPAMLPQFNFTVSEKYKDTFEYNLEKMCINGKKIDFSIKDNNFYTINLGHPNLKSTEIKIDDKVVALEDSGLKNIEIEDKSSSTAYHIPEGHLFIYHPSNNNQDKYIETQMPTCDIYSMLLNNFGIQKENYLNKTSIKF